jgi:hypothetical protein
MKDPQQRQPRAHSRAEEVRHRASRPPLSPLDVASGISSRLHFELGGLIGDVCSARLDPRCPLAALSQIIQS